MTEKKSSLWSPQAPALGRGDRGGLPGGGGGTRSHLWADARVTAKPPAVLVSPEPPAQRPAGRGGGAEALGAVWCWASRLAQGRRELAVSLVFDPPLARWLYRVWDVLACTTEGMCPSVLGFFSRESVSIHRDALSPFLT